MKTLCRQLNYNLEGEYFKGCWDGGQDLSPNWGGIWLLGVGWEGAGDFHIIVNRK